MNPYRYVLSTFKNKDTRGGRPSVVKNLHLRGVTQAKDVARVMGLDRVELNLAGLQTRHVNSSCHRENYQPPEDKRQQCVAARGGDVMMNFKSSDKGKDTPNRVAHAGAGAVRDLSKGVRRHG